MSIRIVFIGAGRMASAIIHGLIEKKHYLPAEIACTCGADSTGADLAQSTGIHYYPEITPAVQACQTLILACKPQQFQDISPKLAEAASQKLILSILAGTSLESLSAKFPSARNIVRTMPNTPGQIGAGVTAFAPLSTLTADDSDIVEKTLSSLGNYHQVEEAQLDAVTALSGSGPAYLFEFAAALREAGTTCGLPTNLATALAIDTLLGSAKLLAQSSDSPEELRNAVTSPGGTTAAALAVFENADFRQLVQNALIAAKERSIELSKL